jgi:NDP-sugar pyrophosphorylase family protein
MIPVLITTSGIGSRLENLTKYTNKSLIPIGDKYAICHIIDKYQIDTEFIITLGYYGHYVRDFLELAYPHRRFHFVNIGKYEGDGSSLGYSMLRAKDYLQMPFIFHCCDTIVNEVVVPDMNKNVLFVNKNSDYISYSSVNVKDNKIIQMNGKCYKDNDFVYTGLSYIYNYQEFWAILDELYRSNPNNSILSDIHVFDIMIKQGTEFIYSEIDSYYDTGNVKSYNETSKKFISNYNILVKENESLCFLDNRVIKFVNDKELNRKRTLRGNNLYPYAPYILDSRDNFIVMELVDGELLSEYKKYGEIMKLLEWANDTLWNDTHTNIKYIKCCHNFYKTKTLDRISKIPFLGEEANIVNGLNTGNIYTLLDMVDLSLITTDTFTKFHGDFILDNILKKSDGTYCLLDWRHEFDTELYYGDIYYDLSKLRHNIIFNHSNILKNLYEVVNINKDEIYVDLKCNYNLIKQLEEYNIFISKYNYNLKKVEILTAIIWLNMAPLYDGKLREFLFYFGKLNLYLALQERP